MVIIGTAILKNILFYACLDDENLVGWREYFDQIKILWL